MEYYYKKKEREEYINKIKFRFKRMNKDHRNFLEICVYYPLRGGLYVSPIGSAGDSSSNVI